MLKDPLAFLVPGGALRGPLLATSPGAESDEPALAGGDRIGPWRIVRQLGQGGVSTVYLAERAQRPSDQPVVLKLTRANPGLRARLIRERQRVAGLSHPAIARVIECGESHDGRLWFAMIPIAGEPIDLHVRRRRLPWRERIALLDAVSDAIDHAHARWLVHRHIKPANILVDERGHPRLLDFGFSCVEETDPARGRGCADHGRNDVPAMHVASDIVQLGMLLRQLLLTGTGACCRTLPQPLPAAVERDLRSVIDAATAAPEPHYRSVADLRSDLQALRSRRPVAARRSSRFHRMARYFARRPLAAMLAAAVALALVLWLVMGAARVAKEGNAAAAGVNETAPGQPPASRR